MFHDGQLISDE